MYCVSRSPPSFTAGWIEATVLWTPTIQERHSSVAGGAIYALVTGKEMWQIAPSHVIRLALRPENNISIWVKRALVKPEGNGMSQTGMRLIIDGCTYFVDECYF